MATADDARIINDAWQQEGSIRRLGMLPAADKAVQAALIPGGGDWKCVVPDGAVTRMIVWQRTEVALINPSGQLSDGAEGDIAMGIRATPVMDKALRAIFVLAQYPGSLDLIRRMARAAIDYTEQPAPRIGESEEDEEGEDHNDC